MFKRGDIIVCDRHQPLSLVGEVLEVRGTDRHGLDLLVLVFANNGSWLTQAYELPLYACHECKVMAEDHPHYSTACQKAAIASLTQCQRS